MSLMDRREFLLDTAALSAALAAAGLMGEPAAADTKKDTKVSKKGDANDQLGVAVVGVNGRGMSHVNAFAGNKGLNTVVNIICDADEGVIGRAMKTVERRQGKAPKFVQDLRKVVEDPSIDIVSIATPNHWHALAAIWALQNGKHVYVEKPVSHNVSEGRRIVEAARHYKKICQAGTQSRSSPGLQEAMKFLHEGKLGKVTLARGLCYKSRPSIGQVKPGDNPIPKTVDYDLWCGPAPKHEPLGRKRFHYDWHWFWDYGSGDLGNQGIHEMDKARWGLGKDEVAKSVISLGGRFGYKDDGETANTQVCVFDYGDCELVFEVRGLRTGGVLGARVGNIWYGTEGYMVCSNYSTAAAFTKNGELIKRFGGGGRGGRGGPGAPGGGGRGGFGGGGFGGGEGGHFANFIKAVRSGKYSDLNADILEGHLSSALCHLGNVSYRLGQLTPFDKTGKYFEADVAGAEALGRMKEHLRANKVALEDTSYHLGRYLAIDPKTETFVNNAEADKFLTRDYRKGFEVPKKII